MTASAWKPLSILWAPFSYDRDKSERAGDSRSKNRLGNASYKPVSYQFHLGSLLLFPGGASLRVFELCYFQTRVLRAWTPAFEISWTTVNFENRTVQL